MDLGLIVTVALAIVGGIVWGIRLEGKVNTIVALREEEKENLNERLDERHNEIVRRLERIERKQDANNRNGGLDRYQQ